MSATATERPAELTFNRKPTVPRNASRPSPTMRYPVARAPLFWAAVAFAIGLYVGQYAWRPPVWWIVAACAHLCAGLYFLRLRPSLSRALTLIGFLFVGALAIQVRGGPELAQFEDAGEDPLEVTAHVTAEGIPQSDGPGHVRQTLDLQADTLRSGSIMKTLPLGVRLNVFSKMESESPQETAPEPIMATDTAARIFHYGERIRFSTVLYRPRNFRNPGAFDYAGYLRDQGITATASIKAAEVERLQGFSGSRVAAAIALARSSIIEHIHSLWPEQTAALLDSMLIAEKSFIEQPTRTDFQRSGTYHMLIVAGLHVGVLAVFTMWLFRFLHCGRVLSDVLTLIVVLIYAALTQEGAPVWRATLMLAVYLITRSLYRHRAALNALGAAALALLVTKPNALMGASFQMSFLCVALIAGVAIPLLEQTVEPFVRGLRNLDALAWDGSLPPRVAQFRVDLRMLLRRVGMLTHRLRLRFVIRRIVVFSLHGGFRLMELGAFSLVMQFGMALPMVYYFHRATSVAVFANLLAVPFLQVLLPAAAIATALSYISLALARLPAMLATFAMSGIAGSVRWLGGMRIADVRLPTPSSASILLASAAIFTAVIFSRTKNRFRLASLIFLAVSATAVWEIPPAEQVRAGILEMTAIDVGQGDSLFLAFPDGHKVLVDAGGLPFWAHSRLDVGEDVVSPYLWARGISRLDAVALTHAHADHMGGLSSVMENFHPREFWLPEGIPDEEIRNLLDGARRDHIKIVYRKAGDSFNYGGAQIRVLAPDPEFPIRVAHRNDESLVMKIAYGKTSALLEADAEKGTEQLVAAEHPEADVLKVAHHGSATSSEPQLLAAVHPRFAVISVGVHNVYHHPRREVLERLRQWNVRTYRTDLDGATSFYLDGLQVAVAAN